MSLVSSLALKLLNLYLFFRFRLSFNKIIIDTSEVENKLDPSLPTLFIANHSTWWDGFFIYELYRKLKLKKSFRIVMLESELKKVPFFRLCGAVGLIPKNPKHNLRIFS
jgi:1-acyl-sn-glycerol-3-phosphate acyltransferase